MPQLYLFLPRPEGKPIVCKLFAWSSAVSTTSGFKALKKKEEGGDAYDWKVKEVCQWMEMRGFGEHTSAFEEHQIDGKALLLLTNKDLISLGVTKIGPRKKFLLRLDELYEKHTERKAKQEEEENKTQWVSSDSVNLTVVVDADMFSGVFVPLLKKQKVPQAALVHYTRIDKPSYSTPGEMELPPGMPYWITKFYNCRFERCRCRASGGSQKLNVGVSFTYESVLHRFLDIFTRKQEHKMKRVMEFLNLESSEEKKRFEEAWKAKDVLFTSPGVVLHRNEVNKDSKLAIWGASIAGCWSPETHSIYNRELKEAVLVTMLCHQRGTNKGLSSIPKHLMYHIFGFLSLQYHLDPFAGFKYPNNEKLRKAIKDRQES